MACRTNRQTAFSYFTRINYWILLGIVVEIVFILLVTSVPSVYRVFSTAALPLWARGLILLAPVEIFVIEEIRKWIVRHGLKLLST